MIIINVSKIDVVKVLFCSGVKVSAAVAFQWVSALIEKQILPFDFWQYLLAWKVIAYFQLLSSKHKKSKQCRFNVGPASTTLDQQ